MPINITLRTQLLGGVSDFCNASGLALFSSTLTLVDLVVALARYKEEGVNLRPEVYVTDDFGAMLGMLPDGDRLKLGQTSADTQGIKLALKRSAPLATDGWAIYLDAGAEIEYGVFRGSSNPISVSVDEIVMTDAGLKIVKVFGVAEECVEIKSSNGSSHFIFFDHRKEDSAPPLQFLDNLIAELTANVSDKVKDEVKGYVGKLLSKALRKSHGSIVAVTDRKTPPQFLARDGICLDTPIDFSALIAALKKGDIQAPELESKRALVEGMLNSDGITLFNSAGQLLAFNCFVKVAASTGVVGGARRRAFSALETRIGRGLRAVFMQSQDGWTDFRGHNAK